MYKHLHLLEQDEWDDIYDLLTEFSFLSSLKVNFDDNSVILNEEKGEIYLLEIGMKTEDNSGYYSYQCEFTKYIFPSRIILVQLIDRKISNLLNKYNLKYEKH